METNRTIVLKRHIVASRITDENGKVIQIIGSGYINRRPDGESCNCSPDALFAPALLPDLGYDEGEIEVNCTISLDEFEGSTPMWCFGQKYRTRCISLVKPVFVRSDKDADTYRNLPSYMYLDCWCENVYFANIPEGAIFPVFIKVERDDSNHKQID